MIDARYLAFDAVVQARSFEAAARRLNLTQSAVSQRIKQLEAELGQVLLVRSKPVQPTPAGRRLLPYVAQLRLIEAEAARALDDSGHDAPVRLSVGVNADSLATWFLPAVQAVVEADVLVLDCVVDDQDHTHALLASGEVLGCVSTRADPMRGCVALALGTMRYICAATPAFCRRHFPGGLTRAALARAPAIIYGRHDDMHDAFLQRHFGLAPGQYPHHVIPSSEGFCAMAEAGLGYGFVPQIQIARPLAAGALTSVAAGHHEDVALFWHHWQVQSPIMARLAEAVVAGARRVLMAA